MSETLSLTSGIAGRYATALFMLAKEERQLKVLQKDLEKLSELMSKSADFRNLIGSPIYKREEQVRAVSEVAKKIKLQQSTEKLLKLMVKKGRVSIMPRLLSDIGTLLENERDEIGFEVVSAERLSKEQSDKLEKTISQVIDKKAKISARIDKSLIGGMIVKIGSRMIDTTIKSKLVKLKNIMKEVN
jgi:F-type H+-transporting ATPase subunit delta